MVRGQYPALWRVREFPSADFYAGYVATYLERDVRQILNIASLRDFERFLRILAARSANLLNKSAVAREVGVSVEAIGTGSVFSRHPVRSLCSSRGLQTSQSES